MSDQRYFNLVENPFILVRQLDGRLGEESLLSVFAHAHEIKEIGGELPTQDFAIIRVLLAILQRAIISANNYDEDREPSDVWGELWRSDTLPMEAIDAYLRRWHHRFYLFDAEQPFMQVAGLRTVKDEVTPIKKIIAELPDGHQFFTMRTGLAAESVSPAEAARWLIHTQAFDTAGIKSGVVGDPAVKSGKSYPIGTGWAGRLGGLWAEGTTLKGTLLLNLRLGNSGNLFEWVSDADLPVWERDPDGPGGTGRMPTGQADLFTWQARRVLLVRGGEGAMGVVLTNGDKIDPYNLHAVEPLTGWYRSKNQEKVLKASQIYLPVAHRPDRSLWRGLGAVLPGAQLDRVDGREYLSPGILEWLAHLASDDGGARLDAGGTLKLRAVGMAYGAQNSTVSEVIHDSLLIQAALLRSAGAAFITMAMDCLAETDDAVRAVGLLAANLHIAAGGDSEAVEAPREHARADAYAALDRPFRRWLAALHPGDADSAALEESLCQERNQWRITAHAIVGAVGKRLARETGPQAFVGHAVKVNNKDAWMTSARAEKIFHRALMKALHIEMVEALQSSTNKEGEVNV